METTTSDNQPAVGSIVTTLLSPYIGRTCRVCGKEIGATAIREAKVFGSDPKTGDLLLLHADCWLTPFKYWVIAPNYLEMFFFGRAN